MAKQPTDGNSAKHDVSSPSPPSTKTDGSIKNDPKFSSILSNEIIPLPPRTIGGLRDQIPKIKQCNCRRSHCLKLYCECFASGIFCQNECRCSECHNIDESNSRYEAIRTTLNRNVNAFRPKVTVESSPSGIKSFPVTVASTSKSEFDRTVLSKSMKPYPQYSNIVQSQPTFARRNAKSNKLGCNCRKSYCLKKYCECFQASIYCSPSCHCTDCKNHVGNAEREVLIDKSRKREEQECIALASAYALGNSGGNSAGNSGVAGVAIGGVVAASANTAILGNDSGGRAEVLAKGVAAGGIDVFLPPYSYAVPSFGQNGDIISFGTVGRQVVGGAVIGGAVDTSLDRYSGGEMLKKDREKGKGDILARIERRQEKLDRCETNLERRWRIATEHLEGKFDFILDLVSKDGDKMMGGIIDEQKQAFSPTSSCESLKTSFGTSKTPIAPSSNGVRDVEPRVEMDHTMQVSKKRKISLSPETSNSLHNQQVAKNEICALMKDMHHIENVLLEVEARAQTKFENTLCKEIKDDLTDQTIPEQLRLPRYIAPSTNIDDDDQTQVLVENIKTNSARNKESITIKERAETESVDKYDYIIAEQVQQEVGNAKCNNCNEHIVIEPGNGDQIFHMKQVSKMKVKTNHDTRPRRNIRSMVIVHDLLNNDRDRDDECQGDDALQIMSGTKSKENLNVANGYRLSYENQDENDLLHKDKKLFIEESDNRHTNGYPPCKLRCESYTNNIIYDGTQEKVNNSSRKRQEHSEHAPESTSDTSNLLLCNEQVPLGVGCSPATKDISMEAVKELYILANQDSSLLHELAKIITKRRLALAAKRTQRKR